MPPALFIVAGAYPQNRLPGKESSGVTSGMSLVHALADLT
jgi:hypothetical protein